MKRSLYIALWTVGAIALAYAWNDWSLGLTTQILQQIGSKFLIWIVKSAIEALPLYAGFVMLVLGVRGRLPGTGQQRPP